INAACKFSNTVSFGKMLVRWNDRPRPIRQVSCGCTPVMSRLSSSTRPLSGRKCPVIRLNSVDLPAPLGPMTAAICRVSTVRDTSETATKPEKDFVRQAISSMPPPPQARQRRVERSENASGEHEQQHHQNRAQHEWPVFGIGSDLLVQQGQHERADRRAPEMVHPAKNRHDHYVSRFRPEHEIGKDAAIEDAEQRAR